MIINKNP